MIAVGDEVWLPNQRGTVLSVSEDESEFSFRDHDNGEIYVRPATAIVHQPLFVDPVPADWHSLCEAAQIEFVRKRRIMVGASTFIDDVTITCGFGELDHNGCWQYPCHWAKRVNTNQELFPELFQRRTTP